MDLIDPFIMAATGSHIGHCVIAMWKDGELYMLESTDGNYFMSPYRGVQMNKYTDWIKWARDADMEVVWAPLTESARLRLNENIDEAWKYFRSVEGLPYGYKSFHFSGLDTESQNGFEPFLGHAESKIMYVRYLEWYAPKQFMRLFGEAMN